MKQMKKIIFCILILASILVASIVLQGYKLYQDALHQTSLENKLQQVKSDNSYITLDKLPNIYKDAVVSVEDRRFYQHSAIDIRSIGRAIITNIRNLEIVEGGSTITQQLAKNLYFSQKQELSRKVAEIFMAFHIEKQCSKDEILELYVNTSYFGDGYYGIKEASLGYFNKQPSNLNDYQSTLLAGIPNAPSVYAPSKNLDLCHKRQQHVLETMIKCGVLSEDRALSIRNNM